MTTMNNQAPGAPGADARWSPGAKSGVGTALNDTSNVWFTLGHGIMNEIYYPQVDTPSVRDIGLIVTDGNDYFSEEKVAVDSKVDWLEPGVPTFGLTNTSKDGRYLITKQVVSDLQRPTILQKISFQAKQGENADYHVFVLVAPHLGGAGGSNTAWTADYQGMPMLFAERDGHVLALACSAPLTKRSVGFVGVSDGWQDLHDHKQMTWQYNRADNGNVALTAEIDITTCDDDFIIATAFGESVDEAAANALASLHEDFDTIKQGYIDGWKTWLKTTPIGLNKPTEHSLEAISLATLRVHESKNPAGGLVAGLASPWGYAQGDDDQIGYHAVWIRDMAESVSGLLAAGSHDRIAGALNFLAATQQTDGHWAQNMWINGTPYWSGVQMDETALPILLVALSRREQAITAEDSARLWPMIKKAAGYLLRNGPVTQQDRWEEDPGYTPFTVAAEVAALLAAADFADIYGQPDMATHLRETADIWHDSIDDWMYARETDWCRQYGVKGYYERVASVNTEQVTRIQDCIHVQNVPSGAAEMGAAHLISPDALALVRFGLRAADDHRIVDTVKVIDALLKIDTPSGTTWHRYNDDGYGEQQDGSAFKGVGIGRGWPLLSGERAHYELMAGHTDVAAELSSSIKQFAGPSGLLPEQVWDSADIPSHELYIGRPTGSATPLAWAHAEYLKLRRSLRDGHVFDLPPQTVQRYLVDKVVSPRRSWRFNHKLRDLPAGKSLRIETLAPATIHWTNNKWQTINDTDTSDTGLGVCYIDIPSAQLPATGMLEFTFYWKSTNCWENQNFKIDLA